MYSGNCLSYNRKDNIAWEEYYLALRTHMGTLGLIYHIHHWTWNWQSQTNLVGTAPSRVLHCGSPPLGPFLPIPSVCRECSPAFQNCIRYENPCCCEKNMVVFSFTQTYWKLIGKSRDANLYLFMENSGFLPPKQCLTKAEQWQISCCFLWGCYTLKSSLTDGETQKNIYSQSSSPEPGSCFQQ